MLHGLGSCFRFSNGLQDRDPGEDDQQYALSRFVPLLQEVLEDMAANSLSADDYPFVSAPTPTGTLWNIPILHHTHFDILLKLAVVPIDAIIPTQCR